MGLLLRLLIWERIFQSIGVLFHLLHPLTLDDCLWQYITDRGSRDCSFKGSSFCSFRRLYESYLMWFSSICILLYVLFKVHKHGFNFMIIWPYSQCVMTFILNDTFLSFFSWNVDKVTSLITYANLKKNYSQWNDNREEPTSLNALSIRPVMVVLKKIKRDHKSR